jgi:hypothetical protein
MVHQHSRKDQCEYYSANWFTILCVVKPNTASRWKCTQILKVTSYPLTCIHTHTHTYTFIHYTYIYIYIHASIRTFHRSKQFFRTTIECTCHKHINYTKYSRHAKLLQISYYKDIIYSTMDHPEHMNKQQNQMSFYLSKFLKILNCTSLIVRYVRPSGKLLKLLVLA